MDNDREIWRHLLEIQRRVGCERNLKTLYPSVIKETSHLLGVDRSSLFLIDWDSMTLRAEFAQGAEGLDIRLALRMGVAGAALLRRQVMNITNAYDHPYFNEEIDKNLKYRTESVLAIPLISPDGRPLGCLEMLNSRKGRFSSRDEASLLKRIKQELVENPAWLQEKEPAAQFIHELCQWIGCDRGTIFVLNEDGNQLHSLYAKGADGQGVTLNINMGIAGVVAVTGESLIIQDAVNDPRFDSSSDLKSGYHTRSILCVPLVTSSDEVIGVVEAINKLEGGFTDDDLYLLQGVASIIAIAVENAILLEEQEYQFRSMLKALAASIDAKDNLTAGHSSRVMEYATTIAQELGFDKGVVDVLEVAALLHDYGKIGIDDMVLKKPGKLTAEEYAHIKQHVTLTRTILDKIRFARKYRTVPLIASAHHEALDGSGYGLGLTAGEIPFMTRIITVADVFEALTATRHYRKSMSSEDAFAILDQGVDSKFDPIVVDALKRCWHLVGKNASNHPQ
ncbi:MAG: GAF domain-containing protein [Magnetococcales bacterium]|nr:GAF domain-containing protein [Magnetococcales bacterium]NGZ28224.1 GAF domain-containing protein [Magnetococcales bacterium]